MNRLIVWTRDVSLFLDRHASGGSDLGPHGAAGQPSRAFLCASLVIVIAVVGMLHRSALTTPWADDRILTADPAWFQMAAPSWHSAIPASTSVANGLTRLVDPLTTASSTGDARAMAALLTALAAAALLMIFRQCAVPSVVAALLCGSLAGLVLPVTTATSVANALQMFFAAVLLAAWSAAHLTREVRLSLLCIVTILGALNHAAFLAFAAGVWAAECGGAIPSSRRRTIAIGGAALLLALFATAWILWANAAAVSPALGAHPGTLEIAAAIVTGRFAEELQPLQQGTLRGAVTIGLPGPLILCVPLAILATVAPQTRRVAAGCVLSGAGVVMFASRTWLPDLAIGAAPARVAMLGLIGIGLTWLWNQPLRGAKVLTLCVAAFIGLQGFVGHARAMAERETAEMHSFVESARAYIGSSLWNVDRLATARALLLRDNDEIRHARVKSGLRALRTLPDDQTLIALTGSDSRLQPDGTFLVPGELVHQSASSFLASQLEDRWLAVALRGGASGDFCRTLLDRLGVRGTASLTDRVVLARLGDRTATLAAEGRLEVAYGHPVDGYLAPAYFKIETNPAAHITVNDGASGHASDGMVLVFFDPWTADGWSWVVGDCQRPMFPVIADRRLKAAVVIESNGFARLPDVPVLRSTAIDVPLGENGSGWFGRGWHGPEAPGANAVRWTAARDADVNVVVSHQQALRVQMTAYLALREAASNSLSAFWNGSPLAPPTTDQRGQREWTIAKPLVRRGVNVLTVHVAELVSPAALGNSSDARLLGAAVGRLSFVPIPSATAAASSTGQH